MCVCYNCGHEQTLDSFEREHICEVCGMGLSENSDSSEELTQLFEEKEKYEEKYDKTVSRVLRAESYVCAIIPTELIRDSFIRLREVYLDLFKTINLVSWDGCVRIKDFCGTPENKLSNIYKARGVIVDKVDLFKGVKVDRSMIKGSTFILVENKRYYICRFRKD